MEKKLTTAAVFLLALPFSLCSCSSSEPSSVLCQPGESICSDDLEVVLTCRVDGSGWDAEACEGDAVCHLGSCQVFECTPGSTQCTENGVTTCLEDGSGWSNPAQCESDEVCYEGECLAIICEPGAFRCEDSPPRVEKCNRSGVAWDEYLLCPEGTSCLDNLCLDDPCDPGQTECGPNTMYECQADGTWESYPCPDGQPCYFGTCIECLDDDACSDGEMCIEGACQYVAPEILTSDLPSGVVGTPYETVLEYTGGRPPLSWSVSEGLLPGGIELTQDGVLSGTPSKDELTEFTVTLQDDKGEAASKAFSLQIYAEGPVHITTKSIKNAKEGIAYSLQLAAAGGSSPYAWQLLEGSLPSGISLGSTGLIAGTPTDIGKFPLKLRVIDASSPPTYDAKDFTLDVRVSPLEITGGVQEIDLLFFKVILLQPLIPFIPYSVNLEARGGLKPYTWTEAPAPVGLGWLIPEWGLPDGLKMNNKGLISGFVTAVTDAVTISIPNGPKISGFFFMGKVTDSQSPSKSEEAIFCIPAISL